MSNDWDRLFPKGSDPAPPPVISVAQERFPYQQPQMSGESFALDMLRGMAKI